MLLEETYIRRIHREKETKAELDPKTGWMFCPCQPPPAQMVLVLDKTEYTKEIN